VADPPDARTAFEKVASPERREIAHTPDKSAAYSERVEKRLKSLESAEKRQDRQRRQRRRPRGRSRRLQA
jgi:hypothetical protein